MMNEARLGVALQGLSQATSAYQAAVAFARDRLQGRSLTGAKNPDGPADPILVHPDVRRMLMDSRAVIEGGRAFLLWGVLQHDLEKHHPDEATRQKAGDLLGLLTPVLKAYLTDKGFEIASNAMQVHGGSGFTEHFPVSQNLRDSRIAMIYEGTNGIQALDLVGRKLAANGGRAIMAFFAELDAYISENEGDEDLKPFVETLAKAKARLQDATGWLMQNGMANPDNAGAASVDYLYLAALAGMAYMWARIAKAANKRIAEGSSDPFYANKLITGRYFLERIAPEGSGHLAKLKSGAATVAVEPFGIAGAGQVVREQGAGELVAIFQQKERRVLSGHRVQIDVEGDEVGLAVLEVDEVLVEIDAVEIGDVAKLRLHIGAEIVDRVACDPFPQPLGDPVPRHAADELAVEALVVGAQQFGQGGGHRLVALDEAEPVLEGVDEVAARAGIDPGVLRVGVELRLGKEEAGVEGARRLDPREQARRRRLVHARREDMESVLDQRAGRRARGAGIGCVIGHEGSPAASFGQSGKKLVNASDRYLHDDRRLKG
jgi:hypothetical protein